jgi:hypothetical protein
MYANKIMAHFFIGENPEKTYINGIHLLLPFVFEHQYHVLRFFLFCHKWLQRIYNRFAVFYVLWRWHWKKKDK